MINRDVNTQSNIQEAAQQQPKKTMYAMALQTTNEGQWNLIWDKTTLKREKECNQVMPPPTQQTPMDKCRIVFLWNQSVPALWRIGRTIIERSTMLLSKQECHSG
jgi:hypothetical protein